MTIRAISKVCEAYKRDKQTQPHFRPHGAMVYDERILSFPRIDRASLLTLDGRVDAPFRCGVYMAKGGAPDSLQLRHEDCCHSAGVAVQIHCPISPSGLSASSASATLALSAIQRTAQAHEVGVLVACEALEARFERGAEGARSG